jgi:cystathionine gamma-synthase
VVDNTFATPMLQQPLALGADVVVHSTTKYLNGHSDVVGGAVVAREQALAEQLAWWANVIGVTGAPFDSYLTLRGLRTLHPRIRSHLENATAVAELLAGHPAVARVHYPGLPDHPGHESWRRPSAGGLQGDVELRAGGWRVRGRCVRRWPAVLHARRITRRCAESSSSPIRRQ